MIDQTVTAVRRTLTVPASQQRAFEVFTAQLGRWWPKEFHIGAAEMANFVIEPRAGGRWYEVGVDGVECDTGRVTVFEPSDRLALAWHLDANWQFDPDPAHASEVEVRFIAQGPAQTLVELEHRQFERHGAGAAGVYEGVNSPTGWPYILELFSRYVAE